MWTAELLAAIPPELVEYYDLDQLLVGTADGVFAWVLDNGVETRLGPFLAETFWDMAEAASSSWSWLGPVQWA